jgi:WhiB family redox-sensing transcriptional regulator
MADQVRPHLLSDEIGEAGALLEMVARGRPPWQKDALCQEHPDLHWFPVRGENPQSAKRLCAECLVFADCRRWSLEQGPELEGVWAGLDRRDRQALRMGRAA